MTMTSRMIAPLYGILAILPMAAQADGPKFSGYVTSTYNYDFNDPKSGYYANDNQALNYYGGKTGSFQMNAAHLAVTGGDSAGATYGIDLDAGTDGAHNVGVLASESGWAFDVQQAFLTVPVFKLPLSVTGGKFYTSEGIEVLNSGANATITRGLLFGQFEPVAHTGAYLTFKASDAVSVSLGAVNGWDNWTTYPASDSTSGWPMAYAKVALAFGNPFSGTVSAYYGPNGGARDALLSLDLTGVNKSVANLAINFQVNYLKKDKANDDGTNNSSFGAGIQPVYSFGAAQIGARYEFASLDIHKVSFDNITVHSISVAPGYKLTQSTLARVEYRIDLASKKIFEDDKGAGTKNDQAITAELNYTF